MTVHVSIPVVLGCPCPFLPWVIDSITTRTSFSLPGNHEQQRHHRSFPQDSHVYKATNDGLRLGSSQHAFQMAMENRSQLPTILPKIVEHP